MPPDVVEVISDSKIIMDEIVTDIREISNNLHPSILNDFGLATAVEKLCEILTKPGNININLNVSANFPRMYSDLEINIYRIIQESIQNALKHSSADKIDIILNSINNLLNVKIIDNGVGFELNDTTLRKGNGLFNIIERCNVIKANHQITSNLNKGTKIEIELSLHEN